MKNDLSREELLEQRSIFSLFSNLLAEDLESRYIWYVVSDTREEGPQSRTIFSLASTFLAEGHE